MHSMTKKVYTFDYGGKVMYLKPTREDNIAMNEFTEIQSNHKRVPKQTNPIEGEIKVKIAETIEKETAEKTHATRGPTEGERPKKPPKIIGMFKPSPPILDIIQVASGVTISTSKNNVRRGVPVKPDGKLRFDEFKEKHRGISPTKLDDSDEARQKVNEKKERREKKYRRTIDNWKEELKKGLQDHINFDADLLINLIMTDEADGNNEKKVQRRAEREKKVNDYFDFKVGVYFDLRKKLIIS